MTTGFVNRYKGKLLISQSSLGRFGKGSGNFGFSGQLFTYASTTGTGNGADTTEDTLATYTLPANCLDAVGRGLQIIAWGNIAATSATKTAKLYFGSETCSVQATTTATGNFFLELNVMKAGSSSQILLAQTIFGSTHQGVGSTLLTGSETDTSGIVIKVTGQSSVATANLVVLNAMSVFAMN